MISAKDMVEIADRNIHNQNVTELEKVVSEAANNGKTFVKLFEGKSESRETDVIFINQYDVEALHHVKRMGYVITAVRDAFDVTRLYIGWGYGGEVELKTAVRLLEPDSVFASNGSEIVRKSLKDK